MSLDTLIDSHRAGTSIDEHVLLESIEGIYPLVTVPKDTLIFHSNTYFFEDIIQLEDFGDSMFIQDIKRYVNKDDKGISSVSLPDSESYSRVYANFTYAANLEVKSNLNVSEHIYTTTTDLYFIQIPIHKYHGHDVYIKDEFQLTSVKKIREYIKSKNVQREQLKLLPLSGFITITKVDGTRHEDKHATRTSNHELYYPEIVIIDGFDKFTKIGQWDLYNLSQAYTRTATRQSSSMSVMLPQYIPGTNTFTYLQNLIDFLTDDIEITDPLTNNINIKPSMNDTIIQKKVPTTSVLTNYFDLVLENIGKFGSLDLIVYKLINVKKYCGRNAFTNEVL